MKKTLLLAAASVLTIGAANASELEVKLKNVNGLAAGGGAPGLDEPTGEATIDRVDYLRRNVNINAGDPHLAPEFVIQKIKPGPTEGGAAVAIERVISVDHPYEAHFEVNVTPSNATAPMMEQFIVNVNLNNAVFKLPRSGATPSLQDVIARAGMMPGEDSYSAFVQFGDEGESSLRAEFAGDGNPATVNTDFGMILPLRITSCGEVSADITVDFPLAVGFTTLGPDTVVLQTCEDSLQAVFKDQPTVKVDFQKDFKGFLDVNHDPIADMEFVSIGSFHQEIWYNIFDPKANYGFPNGGGDEDRRIDETDIANHEVVLTFPNGLTGIKAVGAYDKETGQQIAVADRGLGTINGKNGAVVVDDGNGGIVGNTVTFNVDPSSLVCVPVADPGEDLNHDGDTSDEELVPPGCKYGVEFRVAAFGPGFEKEVKVEDLGGKSGTDPLGTFTAVPTGNGAIAGQTVSITSNVITMEDPCKTFFADGSFSISGNTSKTDPKWVCELPQETGDLGDIVLTGQTFGFFDWVNANGGMANFFRITHIPAVDGHGDPLTQLQGLLTLKNTTGGAQFDDSYPFTLDLTGGADRGQNGVFLLSNTDIRNIVADAGLPPLFGNSDVMFTFFVNTPAVDTPVDNDSEKDPNLKIDVDRLMLANGVLTPYGDNSNDSNSDHARSGDEGRFGPKVPLKK